MPTLQYRAIVHREDDLFWIELPDFPEITHYGALNEEDPADAAAETLADAIILRLEEREQLPEPTVPTPVSVDTEITPDIKEIIVSPRKRAVALAAE